jgi:hypothetical protein
MNHKHVGEWLSCILGIFGYGIGITTLNFANQLLSFMLSMLIALVGGAMGWIGNRLMSGCAKYAKRKYLNRKK